MPSKRSPSRKPTPAATTYDAVLGGVIELLEFARRAAARSVNAVMTATYWEIGRRIVEYEQAGEKRAAYGTKLLKRLSGDLTRRFGRGFSERNLEYMRLFHSHWPISQTASAKLPTAEISQTVSAKSDRSGKSQVLQAHLHPRFPLPWSHYVRLLNVDKPAAREFYESEALRCGWTVRQLNRQVNTLFYERTLASRNKAGILQKGAKLRPGELLTPEEEIKDPLVLEFLNLKDEYSESDLEEALIAQLENFLLELGGHFAFVGRQKRLRVGDQWYRIDLLFFHRKLKCLVVIDLKLDELTAADAGQMHLYLNYAREHWTNNGENPPVGVILCAQKDHAVAHYALDGLPNKVLAAQYKTTLPAAATLAAELTRTRRMLEERAGTQPQKVRRT